MRNRLGKSLIAGLVAMFAVSLAGLPAKASAQDYPNRPVRIISPFPAGSAIDSQARMIAIQLEKKLGQKVIVENKPGGGTVIATQYVINQPADGYTIGLVTVSAGIKSAIAKPPFDLRKDLTHIAAVSSSTLVLGANTRLPFTTFKGMIDYAKANPGKLNISSYGVGTLAHLTAELLVHLTGAKMTHVPYQSSILSTTAVGTGEADVAFDVLASFRPQFQSGKAQPLAVSTRERYSELPDVPGMRELGIDGMHTQTWGVLSVPAGTPRPVVSRLSAALNEALKEPELVEFYKRSGYGLNSTSQTPEQTSAMVTESVNVFAKLIRDAKLNIQ